ETFHRAGRRHRTRARGSVPARSDPARHAAAGHGRFYLVPGTACATGNQRNPVCRRFRECTAFRRGPCTQRRFCRVLDQAARRGPLPARHPRPPDATAFLTRVRAATRSYNPALPPRGATPVSSLLLRMRNEKVVTVRREDYRAPIFLVDHIELTFDLDPV